ncbi:hypothetical protein FRB99_004284 [Tulasnella sp. 403]|nr:hypothetical protein FRB99_004284 [Tulasnella sp. 403]
MSPFVSPSLPGSPPIQSSDTPSSESSAQQPSLSRFITPINKSDPTGRASPGSNSSLSSGEVVFSKASDQEDEDDEPDHHIPPSAVPRKQSSRHLHRMPRKMRSGAMSLSAIDSPLPQTGPICTQPPSTTVIPPSPGTLFTNLDPFAVTQETFEQHVKRQATELQADAYTLCSFSTGQILEEFMDVASYRFRPNEMLEIQRKYRIVNLPRTAYEVPYFDAPAYVHLGKEKESKYDPFSSFALSQKLYHVAEGTATDQEKSSNTTLHIPSGSQQLNISTSHTPTSTGTPAPSDTEPRRQPYRSHSANFKPLSDKRGGKTQYENNLQDERERWKGKEQEADIDTAVGSFVPIADVMPVGTATPSTGFGWADHEAQPSRKAQRKLEKEMKEVRESMTKLDNWKARWVFVKDDALLVWKERPTDPPPPQRYDLTKIQSIEEQTIPQEVCEYDPKNTNPYCIAVRFKVHRKTGPLVGRPVTRDSVPTMDVVLRIRVFDTNIHENLLRVLYRALVATSLASPGVAQYRPPPSSFSPSSVARAMSPSDIIPRSPSPVHHRNSISMSSNVSEAHSQVSHVELDLPRPTHKRSLNRLPGLPRMGSSDLRQKGKQKTVAENDPWDDDSESARSVIHSASVPVSPSSSPHHTRRISLNAAVKMVPPAHPSPSYMLWREAVVKRCIAAGRGESELRGRGRYRTALGPWQIHNLNTKLAGGDSCDDETDRDDDPLGGPRMKRRPKLKPRNSAEDEPNKSEYEWENWRVECGYSATHEGSQPPSAAGTPLFAPPVSPFIPGGLLGDLGLRRGSVPSLGIQGKSPSGFGASFSKRVVEKAAAFPGVTTSIADAVIGRNRSKSVVTITPQSPGTSPRIPTPPIPDTTPPTPLTASSVSPLFPSPSSSSIKRMVSVIPTVESPGRRARSSTVAVPSIPPKSPLDPLSRAVPSLPERPPRSPMPPSLLKQYRASQASSMERKEAEVNSDDSDISLNSALNMARPSASLADNPPVVRTASVPSQATQPPPPPPRSRKPTIEATASGADPTGANAAALAALTRLNPTVTIPMAELRSKRSKSSYTTTTKSDGKTPHRYMSGPSPRTPGVGSPSADIYAPPRII